ncbi:pyrroloquinoline quinone biosynthesis peptide chaperone PqqD [Pseudoroseomonas wenyumeiae]|uniref:Pyrroloquinoline quinone biosynthesis peptide chaperone PqqD n=1 Tax=Teichococcus wenyumeiae TaxID=2478470 RepID=A0A3A9JI01_9PROT|nr:pyrroloquinoline quinone biosynthesis peptide chaperone PqqD [Pseudoroseomonas wenyumeiae]RKK04165.1 pyrroloquinoline quinone biosynthesis peptide chaperone PqqD [Pseudoroseomonas wenyumeiae]RMI19275.1 pyrroloquinoline quinone biosynthesis peptide chaperone PqqD [Pseudoroseomonas wenyumeiae]
MTVLGPESRLCLGRGARLRHDTARDRWVVLAPERMFIPDPTALEVLRLIDGTRSVAQIAEELAARYAAPQAVIEADILPLLQELSDKGVVVPA